MTTTPQAALLSAQNPLLKRCYTMSESHLSGYRVVIGFERLEDAQDAHEYIAKLQATQEPVQAVPEAMKVVTEALRSDPDYAWSWHCNVAMASVDEGMGHYEANQAAARFMHSLAGVDTTKHQGFPEAPKQEPVQAGELPPLPLPNDHNGYGRCPARYTTDQMYSYARAALSARKPLTPLTPAQMEKGRDQIFSINNPFCPCDSKTFRKVAEWVERHHGIGLEVKP